MASRARREAVLNKRAQHSMSSVVSDERATRDRREAHRAVRAESAEDRKLRPAKWTGPPTFDARAERELINPSDHEVRNATSSMLGEKQPRFA